MIEQLFPTKRVKQVYQPPHNYQSHNSSIFNETSKATARGLSLMEYRDRVMICAKAARENKWLIGMEGYPFTKDAMREHGKCRVVAIVTHFDNYGTVEWNDPPFILSVVPVNGTSNEAIQCSINWLVEKNPLEEETNAC